MYIYLSLIDTEEERSLFEKVYKENFLRMYHIALSMLKGQSEAENAVHEAFLSIAERFQKYAKLSSGEMTGLCITIVKNKAIDQLRLQSRYSDIELENLVMYNCVSDYEPDRYVVDKEEYEQLRGVLEKLPEVLKVVLYLKYYYDYDNREISKALNIPLKTVEMRLYRGKKKLRELLGDE